MDYPEYYPITAITTYICIDRPTLTFEKLDDTARYGFSFYINDVTSTGVDPDEIIEISAKKYKEALEEALRKSGVIE